MHRVVVPCGRSMWSFIVIEVLPLGQLSIETTPIFNHDTFEKTIKLFFINAMRPLNFAVETRRAGLDVDMCNVQVLNVPVEQRASGTGLRTRCRYPLGSLAH